ncbi:lactate dehydrogenase [Demequina sp. SYSU T00068]|uniref:lactate/malate family dehydrogenase n=1 Tax=Demequina lignilytica TaxID=3051663 RepID=UPI002603E262|nr:lactate dehydrogenase [Demequina sp. SYSU T00068]MDN4490068.1 lactate dehydrogenase [Demequina sp. SYSU T00068]
MDVSIVGATGDVGRAICGQLIERGELGPTSRLQLVGRPGGASGQAVHGLRVDLIDAHDEHAPHIDVADRPEDVVADVVVMAAGRTLPTGTGVTIDRDALARDNRRTFEEYADALAEHGSGHEIVIVVANPVELAVEVFSHALGRHRVIGMGAWLDTLRFRREIAATLGIRRHRVGGFVAGQHGDRMVPLWSAVRLRGLDADERAEIVTRLRGDRTLTSFASEIAAAKQRITGMADIAEAFAAVDTLPPDVQAVVRPYLTHQSGAKTAHGTANATVDLIRTILDGRDIVVAGQVLLDGEIELGGMPWRGVLGVPVAVGPDGWTRVMLDDLAADERRMLWEVGQAINESLVAWGGGAP